MIAVSFLLKEPNGVKPTPIFAFVAFDGRRVKVATGLKIEPRQWLKDQQEALTRGFKQNGAINDRLELIKDQLTACYSTQVSAGHLPTAEQLRAAVVLVEATEEPAASRTFWNGFAEWIALTRAAGQVRTAQTYSTAARHLREFGEATGTRRRLRLDYAHLGGQVHGLPAAYRPPDRQHDSQEHHSAQALHEVGSRARLPPEHRLYPADMETTGSGYHDAHLGRGAGAGSLTTTRKRLPG